MGLVSQRYLLGAAFIDPLKIDINEATDSNLTGQIMHPNSPAHVDMGTTVGYNHSQWSHDLPNVSLHLRKIALNGHSLGQSQKSHHLSEAFIHYFESSSMLVSSPGMPYYINFSHRNKIKVIPLVLKRTCSN